LVKSGDYELPGIITIPKGLKSYPIVVFIHGSGPNDRDETFGPNKPFHDLAQGLASHGIACLRYDKRTFVYGKKSAPEGIPIDIAAEVLIDANNAIALAANYNNASGRVFVLGHSLGGMLAPKIANENQLLEGIILMAGNARPLEKLIVEQYRYLFAQDGINQKEEKTLIDLEEQIDNLEKLKKNPEYMDLQLPLDLSPSYWKSLLAYDQVSEMKAVNTKILILQGERDYQVTMEDFQLWKNVLKNNSRVSFISYPKLNHLFLEGEGPSYPSEYQVQGYIPDYVIKDIADWILEDE